MTTLTEAKALFEKGTKRTLSGHRKKVHTLAWNSTGKLLASGASDGTIRLWSAAASAASVAELAHPKKRSAIIQLCWNPAQEDTLAAVGPDACLDVWDARAQRVRESVGGCGDLISVSWSPDGALVALGDKADNVRIVDAKTWRVVKQAKFPFEVDELAWHPDPARRLLFLATGAGTVEAVAVPACTPFRSVAASTAPVEIVRFDASGRYFALGGADDSYSLWDCKEFACVRMFTAFHSSVRTLSFSHDGQFIAAGAETALDEARVPSAAENFVDVCQVETGQSVQQISTGAGVNVVTFNPKQLQLAWCVSDDPNVYLFSAH